MTELTLSERLRKRAETAVRLHGVPSEVLAILADAFADIDSLTAENASLRARVMGLEAALVGAVRIAEEARREWDAAPSGAKAGKLLIALGGNLPGYRRDIDAIIAALPKPPVAHGAIAAEPSP